MNEGKGLNGIGDRVRAARERAGLSREALAFHSGISWSAIAQVETGRRTNVRPGTLAALAGVLGVTIDYLVSGPNPGDGMLEHRALFYEDESQFLAGAVAFLEDGVNRAEAALAVTSADRISALRSRLGHRAKRVTFADHVDWYRDPADALAGYREFVKTSIRRGAPWVRILGEPLTRGRSQAKLREWSRYESLLHHLFSGEPVSLLCPYDCARLDPQIIDVAHATHRPLRRDD